MSRTHFFQRGSTGAPATGITHTVTTRYDNDTPGPSVTVQEVGTTAPGCYYFDASPTGNLFVMLDAGAGVTVDEYRYHTFLVGPDANQVTPGNIADAVWDEALSGHLGAGSAGKALDDTPTASEAADAVWDEQMSGHTLTGSAGKALTDGAVSGPTAAAIADAVWDEAMSGHETTGTFGRMAALMQAMAGLNRRVISTTYSGTPSRPTSQTVALYRNPTDANADTNRLATITVARSFDALGRPTTSKRTG